MSAILAGTGMAIVLVYKNKCKNMNRMYHLSYMLSHKETILRCLVLFA